LIQGFDFTNQNGLHLALGHGAENPREFQAGNFISSSRGGNGSGEERDAELCGIQPKSFSDKRFSGH
jgi:hypothetical protein